MSRFVLTLSCATSEVANVVSRTLRVFPRVDKLYVNVHLCDRDLELQDSRVAVKRGLSTGVAGALLIGLENETDPDTLIAVIDPSAVFLKDPTQVLIDAADRLPGSAVCLSGWNFGIFPFISQLISNNTSDQPVDVALGSSAVVYRRGMFDLQEFKRYRPTWTSQTSHRISAYLSAKRVPRVCLGVKADDYVVLTGEAPTTFDLADFFGTAVELKVLGLYNEFSWVYAESALLTALVMPAVSAVMVLLATESLYLALVVSVLLAYRLVSAVFEHILLRRNYIPE